MTLWNVKSILVVKIIICIKRRIVHFRSVELEKKRYFKSIDRSPVYTGRYAKLSFLLIFFFNTEVMAVRVVQAF